MTPSSGELLSLRRAVYFEDAAGVFSMPFIAMFWSLVALRAVLIPAQAARYFDRNRFMSDLHVLVRDDAYCCGSPTAKWQ
jgi:hypothetical protein